MRLARVGPVNSERPVVLLPDGYALDASTMTPDFGPQFFSQGVIEELRHAVELGSLSRISIEGERIGSPISRPGKIVCVGLNYRLHVSEAGVAAPSEPVLFLKAPSAMCGPYDDLLLPLGSSKTDWEVELAVVIGKPASYLRDEADVRHLIAGYCVSNDVSERSFQLERAGQWDKGKSCATFYPLGPWLVTADDVDLAGDVRLWTTVNGKLMQSSTTAEMIFGIDHLIWYISQFMVLEPGDIVSTGTPGGVGHGLEPPVYLTHDDVVSVGIDQLGSQRQLCRQVGR